MNKIIVWALYDSGNGCYYKVAKEFDEIKIFSVGMDIENKNNHFINLNLADYSYFFGDNKLYDVLNTLPQPDLIIASPPCESWSIASAMKNGNACWKQETLEGFVKESKVLSKFTIRPYKDYKDCQKKRNYNPEKQLLKRINGELCTFNLIQIIKKYKPKYFIIENPATSRIWEYIDKILGFNIDYENLTRYNNYNYHLQKPTKFKSNMELNLKNKVIKGQMKFEEIHGYNNRSNIPLDLVRDIFKQVISKFKRDGYNYKDTN